MATRKKTAPQTAAAAPAVEPFEHDFVFMKSTNLDGRSSSSDAKGFQWPSEVGAMVEAPDWNPAPICGGGLHGLADGLGDWGLMATPASREHRWYVLGAKRSEAVSIDGTKIKVPRCKVLYFGDLAGAMQLISPAMTAAIIDLVKTRTAAATPEGKVASGVSGAATASGFRGAATASGVSGAATASGDRGAATASGVSGAATASGFRGAATASGFRGAATASGFSGAATASGFSCVALACGRFGSASVRAGCLLVLVERDEKGTIVNHFAAMAGQQGVEVDRWYTLREGALVDLGPVAK